MEWAFMNLNAYTDDCLMICLKGAHHDFFLFSFIVVLNVR